MKDRLTFRLKVRVNLAEGRFKSCVWMKFLETVLVVDDLEDIYGSVLYNAVNISNRMIRHEEI